MTKRLLEELQKTPGYESKNPLIKYIKNFDRLIGADQKYTINLAKRIGIDLSLDRYAQNENVTLREVLYYEILFYIQNYEENREKLNLPKTRELININKENFKKLYDKTIVNGYEEKLYNFRFSIMTDYVKYGNKNDFSNLSQKSKGPQ